MNPLPSAETARASKPLKDMSYLQQRRRQARRRRHLLRVDLGVGLFIAVLALLLAPGIALVAIAALLVLALCAGLTLLAQWRSRRG